MDRGARSGLLDGTLIGHLNTEWQTAAQVQRQSGGETLEVAKALDRLWAMGQIDRQTLDIGIGTTRKGGGAKLRRIRYRRKNVKPGASP